MKFNRIARYFTITASVTFIAYVLRTAVSMLTARQGAEAIIAVQTYFSFAVNLLVAIIVAALNRRYVFRSILAWGIAIPVTALLEVLFDTLTDMLWQPMIQAALAHASDMQMGAMLQTASYTFNLAQFTLWAVLSYLFQRFVLYRESLDTNLSTNDEGVHSYE